ncbi:MAG TPA: SMC family ATPase [Rubrobacteraceae bacterium]|nr:SMC family ATPase [Rubrobacteraceae bacterium]
MNLERLYIENYKQLREPVELLPPEGAIGVVGRNGSGKSTLFESILWAFFGSRGGGPRFANELIPWSGGSAKDKTVVEVTLAVGGDSYTVRRGLRSNQTTAEAQDSTGKTIVTGTTDVTRWVEEHLLRMDRTAFEATFYARQKELKFFAQDDGIGRVRRISKMLGIHRVEGAQKLLREDRNDLRAEARLIEGRLAESDEDALKEQLEEFKTECKRLEEDLERISGEYESAQVELDAARKSRAALDATHREHVRLTNALQMVEGERRRSEDRTEQAERDLAEISTAEEELRRLKPQIQRLPELEKELERLEDDRRRSEQRDRDRKELRTAQARIAAIETEVSEMLEELDSDGESLPGWDGLFELDGAELLGETVVVLGEADERLEQAEERLRELREMEAAHAEHRRGEEELVKARERCAEARRECERISEEIEDLSGGDDLEARERGLREEEEKLRELAAARRGAASANEREARNVDKAREAIASGAEDHCPTCHREFESGEHADIVETLNRQAAAIRRLAAKARDEADQHTTAADAAEEKLQKVTARLGSWRELRETLVRAETAATDREEALQALVEQQRNLETKLGGSPAPSERDLEDAQVRCAYLRSLRDALPGARSLQREHSGLVGRAGELAAELESLAGVSYDPDLYRERREEKASLERVQGRVEELERRVATRPAVERALEDARTKVREAGKQAETLRGQISALGFDEEEYDDAGVRVAAAEEKTSRLRDAREHTGGEWKDADHKIERVSTELKRLEADRKLANQRAAGAARMDEMDRLFTDFFRSLTARVRPMLEVEASNLVRELTDGRYERMEFDDNYRVKLLDRFDDSYAIERFSGGEADVASLSARIALSKIIAARGSEALGFLVLDEVFGSLDTERRNNVLLALERLKRSFGQIFIISHVGDVQESALLDELWMIEEDEDGKSTVRRVEQAPIGAADLLQDAPA